LIPEKENFEFALPKKKREKKHHTHAIQTPSRKYYFLQPYKLINKHLVMQST